MKLVIPCMQCLIDFGKPDLRFSNVVFCDEGHYLLTCRHGHETVTLLQQQKFEILFDIGAYAILDGYYREAVSSFQSSLECFYAYCISVFLSKIDKSMELYDECWKVASKQSERQLGAFIFLWATHFGKTPSLLNEDFTKFRNEIIHKGKIPSQKEAIEYGDAVIKIIQPQIKMLKEKFPTEITDLLFMHLEKIGKDFGNKRRSSLSYTTILSLNYEGDGHADKNLESHLEGLKKQRELLSIFAT